jgi:hypothetical protein
MEVVAAAIGLVIPYLARAGGAVADEGLRTLWAAMTARAEDAADDAARGALAGLHADPNDPARKDAATQAVTTLAAGDPAFRAELTEIVKRLADRTPDVTMSTTVSGNARVDKLTNIQSAGNVTIS